MLLKFGLRGFICSLLLFTAHVIQAQPEGKTADALEEKIYDRAIAMMRKDYFKGEESLAYYIAEAYRKSFDYAQTNEWHMRAISAGNQPSFYGYCMTMLQMGRLNECLKYANKSYC